MRILLAEDNKINQKYAMALLGSRFHLTIAENGAQAVEKLRDADFDVILMDIQMPELDGPGATRIIRAMPAPKCHVPIVAMTANAQPGAREEYLSVGMDDYVSKPISPAALLALLERYRGEKDAGPAAPVAEEPEEALLDRETLSTLSALMGPEPLDNLLLLFVQDADAGMEAIATGLTADDFAAVARTAHALVSSAGNVGAMRVSRLARALEMTAQASDKTGAEAILATLRRNWAQTRDAIGQQKAAWRAVA